MHTHRIFLSMALLFFIQPLFINVLHADTHRPGDRSTFLVYYENDTFANTDEQYTAALKVTWISKDLRENSNGLPGWGAWLVDITPGINRRNYIHNLAVSLGQNIYTPEDIKAEELIEDDRPYAGWTYLSLGLHNKNYRVLNSLDLTLGIVGPSSLAEESQKTIHDLIDSDDPRGWDNQLEDEPGLMLSWQRYWRMVRTPLGNSFATDMIPHAGITLGNVFTYANTGFEARIGYNLPVDFGTSLIGSVGGTEAPISMGDPRMNTKSFGVTFFAGVDGRAIAQNIFLDGNTFTDSHSVDKKNFVADLYAGFSLTCSRFKLTYTHVMRTEEFEGQDGNHYFGSVSLGWTF